ncbi:hypothetical protein GCM10017576_21340 [Microbacterium barkeri]|uniref:Uncharacterized protein n=1 Tax=Microbacterium barkeri TaxID=33917 RepID=A0A9W6LWP3_9MICO|nr:hypothetical protein GCM10017576_21340 [Microbacterium barkeri]
MDAAPVSADDLVLVQLETATREELAPEEAKALEAPAEGVLSGRSESGVHDDLPSFVTT